MNPGSRWTCPHCGIVVALLSVFAGFFGELWAQGGAAAGGGWRTGLSLGGALQLSGPVHEFSSKICPGNEIVLEGRAGFWMSSRRGFLVSLARHGETEGGRCGGRQLVAPPDSGTVTYVDGGRVEGYPYGSATVRMILGAGPDSGIGSHGYLGVQWLWGKGVVPLVGMGLNLTGRRGTIFLEGDGRLHTLPTEVVTAEYRGGQPTRVSLIQGRITRPQMALRVGFDLPLRSFPP